MDNLLNLANAHQRRCPRCQSPLNTVVVHAHEQYVSQSSLSAAQRIPVGQIINWLLDIKASADAKCGADRNVYPLTMLH